MLCTLLKKICDNCSLQNTCKTRLELKEVKNPMKVATSNIQALIEYYKKVKGIGKNPEWDKKFFPRFSRSAKQILQFFDNDVVKACRAIDMCSRIMRNGDYTMWNLSTVGKWIFELREKMEKEDIINRKKDELKKLKKEKEKAEIKAEKAAVPMPGELKEALKDLAGSMKMSK